MNTPSTSELTPIGTPLTPRTSGLAITSLVLGFLGFLIVPAIAGLICGIIAWIQINRSAGALKGMGFAIAGTVLSGAMLTLAPIIAILAALLLPALASAKNKAQTIMSLNNVKQINLALHMYADDSGGLLPATTNWCDALRPYLGGGTSAFLRPEDQHHQNGAFSSYALNTRIAGMKIEKLTPNTVTVFETASGGWNISGGPELLPRPLRSGKSVTIGFADGHSESTGSKSRLESLQWDP